MINKDLIVHSLEEKSVQQTPEKLRSLLNYKETAAALRISEITLRKWVSQKKIPFIKIGSAVRFDSKELDCWISNHSIHVGGHNDKIRI